MLATILLRLGEAVRKTPDLRMQPCKLQPLQSLLSPAYGPARILWARGINWMRPVRKRTLPPRKPPPNCRPAPPQDDTPCFCARGFARSRLMARRVTRRAAAAADANMAAMNITGAPDARYPDEYAEFSGMYKCVCPESDTGLCDEQRRNHMFGNVTIGLPADRGQARLQLDNLYKNRMTSRKEREEKIEEILNENDEAGSQCRRIAYVHYRAVDRTGSAATRLGLANLTSEAKDMRRNREPDAPSRSPDMPSHTLSLTL